MPSLGADMEAGTLVEWMIKPGDSVKRGDVVAVVETQKGAIEIEIFETGQVERILVDVGGKVPVGTPLARIHSEQEAKVGLAEVPQLPEVRARGPVPAAPAAQVPAAPKPQIVVEVETRGRVRASPVARRLAAARGIDLAAITGSCPLGAIILYDLELAVA